MGSAPVSTGRALTGAVLLDLAVSPLFAWDIFTETLRRDLGVSTLGVPRHRGRGVGLCRDLRESAEGGPAA